MIPKKFKYKLFGRFRGRKKNHYMVYQHLDKYNVNIKLDIDKKQYNILDIGSGSGESTLYLSSKHINSKIITCELFKDGNINLCNEINKNEIENIRLFQGNVLEFLDKIDSESIFDEIWILFPDPWPKVRHHKRRLINNKFLKKIYLYLKYKGKIIMASDSESYIHSIGKTIYDLQSLYVWENQSVEQWTYGYLDLPITKFYKKALKSNKNTMFFKIHKI